MEWLIGLVAVVAIFIILPTTLSGHITQNARHKRDKEVEKLQLQKEMLALEVEKEKRSSCGLRPRTSTTTGPWTRTSCGSSISV
jgi:hypothetical protein